VFGGNAGGYTFGSTATLGEELVDLVFHVHEHAFQVNVDIEVEILNAAIGRGGCFTLDTGIIKGDIELSVGVHGTFDQSDNIGFNGNIAALKNSFTTGGNNSLDGCLASLFINIGDHNLGASLGKYFCRRCANTTGCTGYQGDFPVNNSIY